MLSMASKLTEIFKNETWRENKSLAEIIKVLDERSVFAVHYPVLSQFFQVMYSSRHRDVDKALNLMKLFLNFAAVGLDEAAATRLDKLHYFNDFFRILFLNFAQLVDKTRSGVPSQWEMVSWIQGVKQQMADLNGGTKDYSWFIQDVPTAIFAGLLLSGYRTGIQVLDEKTTELHDIMLARLRFYIDVQCLVSKIANLTPTQGDELLAETQRLRAKLTEYSHDSGSAEAIFKHNPDKSRAWSLQAVVGLGRSPVTEVGKARYKAFCQEYNEVFAVCQAVLTGEASATDRVMFVGCVKEAKLSLENLFFVHKLMDHPLNEGSEFLEFSQTISERICEIYISPTVAKVNDLNSKVMMANPETKVAITTDYFTLIEKVLTEPLPVFGRILNKLGKVDLEAQSLGLLSPELEALNERSQRLSEAWTRQIAKVTDAMLASHRPQGAHVMLAPGEPPVSPLAGAGVPL